MQLFAMEVFALTITTGDVGKLVRSKYAFVAFLDT